MKFERFIATFVMLNIVLLAGLVFSAKNHLIMKTISEIINGKETSSAYFDRSPSDLASDGFKTDSKANIVSAMAEVYKTIPQAKLDEISALPPYERAVAIVKSFSLMGDGKCLINKTIPEKLALTSKKEGCAMDFAQIFSLIATYTGLDNRIVSNGIHYGAEIYDGKNWIYIDPYFAMSVSSEDSVLSYKDFSQRMISDGWMRFNFFGGENHCMSGKDIGTHPYFGDKMLFATIYTFNGNNVIKMAELESKYGSRPAFIKYLKPYKEGMPAITYTAIASNINTISKKYIMGLLAVLATIFIGTNIVLPIYYLTGVFSRLSKKK